MAAEQQPHTEQQLDWNQLLDTAITAPGAIGSHYSALYSYSFLNQMFLLAQGCPIEPIGTFNRWRDLNRQVLKGSKAFSIIRPITIKREDEASGETKAFTRFKPVKCIFPASMTKGEALPPITAPDWDEETALAALDITRVPYESFDGGTQGYSFERKVAISPIAKYAGKTLLHEISHVVGGHTTESTHAEYLQHQGRFEFEAEAPAFLISKELDISTPEQDASSRGYLQHWMRGEKPGEQSIRRVFQTTDAILKAGRLTVAEAEVA